MYKTGIRIKWDNKYSRLPKMYEILMQMWREIIFIDVRKHSDPESQLWNDDLEKGSENTGLLERLPSWGLSSESAGAGASRVESRLHRLTTSLTVLRSLPLREEKKGSLVRKVMGSFSQSTLSRPWLHYLTIHSSPSGFWWVIFAKIFPHFKMPFYVFLFMSFWFYIILLMYSSCIYQHSQTAKIQNSYIMKRIFLITFFSLF